MQYEFTSLMVLFFIVTIGDEREILYVDNCYTRAFSTVTCSCYEANTSTEADISRVISPLVLPRMVVTALLATCLVRILLVEFNRSKQLGIWRHNDEDYVHPCSRGFLRRLLSLS